ncbi:SDR family NAD(P)-dependent oxidoreductase [Undibacterium sp. TJN25]|uniref:SDR family NAD(P)-dependent oxidoreductase n=1 Tax=Undibacterium sp. TJN25 TaxID=3413056 RepID=UPI003BF34DBE
MNAHTNKGTALITGASSGIGAVYADRLARRGYDLILVARDQKRLAALADKLGTETGRKVETIAADLTKKADLLKLEQRLRSDSAITLLLNNAGVGATAKLVDSDLDKMEEMIQLNVTALIRLSGGAAASFSQRGSGIVINIASIVAIAPEVLNGTYSGSKAFVVNFTQSMHHELAAKGIQVQAVLPGATSTDFWDKAGVAVQHLPSEIVMTAKEMVDAALVGLDQRELITIPSLPNAADWDAYDAARKHLGPNLSRKHAAERYKAA